MKVRVLDMDGGVTLQKELLARTDAQVVPLAEWGPRLRLACSHRRFRRFEQALAHHVGHATNQEPTVSFVGSGDFHHVSLALVRRIAVPFNLLIVDNHPDWMRHVPFLHCGTWVYHAAMLPNVARVYHLGGDVDFDNAYRLLAPWHMLRSGKIVVLPAIRRFLGRAWGDIKHESLRERRETPCSAARLRRLLEPYGDDLARRPLYVSLDKDVMTAEDSTVNWDSGHLCLEELTSLLEVAQTAAKGQLVGMDVVGDWSQVRLRGAMRRLFHWTMHPLLAVDQEKATAHNQAVNLRLLDCLFQRAHQAA
jgi:hypothetical protein